MLYRVVAADAFSTQRQSLWDLCYRATGNAADADMLLRDCFARAVARPLVSRAADWRPHLMRSAAILAMEVLRHRKRRRYVGCWLPSPVETGNAASRSPSPVASLHGPRYDMVESGSMAFLRALEALDPRERLIFIMSDALGIEVQDAAATLEITSLTARGALQSARRKMQGYDSDHAVPTAELQVHTADMLRHFLSSLQNRDPAGLEEVLAPDVQSFFDCGGEFVAPLAPVSGAAKVTKLLLKFAEGTEPMRLGFRMLNGLPAALVMSPSRPRWARRFVVRIETRGDLVSEAQTIMASAKLTAVTFDPF